MASSPATTRLRALHQASERIAANLVELELDSGRQLLEAIALRGESASRWSAASAALTELWRRHGLLQALLERADRARGSELEALLQGPSIDLRDADVPLADRRLPGSARSAHRCTPDELLRTMSDTFDSVKAALAAISRVWEALTPRLDEARLLLAETTALADEVGDAGRGDLQAAARELLRLDAAVTADPLSVQPAEVDALQQTLGAIHEEIEAATALKHDLDARLADARRLLDRVRARRRRR